MVNRLVQFALANRVLVFAGLLAVLIGGGWTVATLPRDAYPDVTPPMVRIFTVSPGLSPVDVEKRISYPVSIAMYGLPQLDRIQSTSVFGLSRVTVYFKDGTDIYFARRLVMERLQVARQEIPEALGVPQLGPITTALGRVLMYTVENEPGYDYSLMERRTAQDWLVGRRLRTVPNVTDVLSIGGFVRQFQVELDPQALLARSLTVGDVRAALMANNRNVGASFINRGGEEYIVRGFGWIGPDQQGLADIRRIVLAEHQGRPVYMRDVATVSFGPAIRRGALIANGEEAVGGYVLKLIYAPTQKLLEAVEQRIKQINAVLPEGMVVRPFYTQQQLIDAAITTVEHALRDGFVLVLIFLWIFLGNLRSALIVIASLPLAALIAFLAMRFAGLSANLMSLSGLAIGIGMIIDGSVVMMENIFRHLEAQEDGDDGPSIQELVRTAAGEVAQPIMFSVSIIIIVFLPLFSLQGNEGKLFSPMAYSVSFALIGALLAALTVVPVLCTFAFSRRTKVEEPRLIGWLKRGYRPILHRATAHPVIVLLLAIGAFGSSLVIFPRLGTEFVPPLREGTLLVQSLLPPSANLPSSIEFTKKMQAALDELPEVEGVFSRVGRAEVGGDPALVNVITSVVTLQKLGTWSTERNYAALQTAVTEALNEGFPGVNHTLSQPIQMRSNELITGVLSQLVVSIYGPNLATLQRLGEQVLGIIRSVEGTADSRLQQQFGKPQIEIRPDREALARYGMTVDQVLEAVEIDIGGMAAKQVFEGVRRFDVFVRLQPTARNSLPKIRELPLRTPSGELIPLSRVADLQVFDGPRLISRNLGERRAYVLFGVRGRDMGSVMGEIQQQVQREVSLPPLYRIEYGGEFENQQRAMRTLYIAVPITLALIFLMLYSAFSSLRYAALIFLNVPFAITGGIFALWLSGLYLSVPGAVGFIAVLGVAVLNGVVLIRYINDLREEGRSVEQAVHEGAELRLRPVLMTAAVAILGLVPLLLATGIGANVQRPLAAVVVGGLITSTLLTLVVLPAVYPWFAPDQEDDTQRPPAAG